MPRNYFLISYKPFISQDCFFPFYNLKMNSLRKHAFTTKNCKFSDKKIWYFFKFLLKT